jgi:branched-chain amino acid transport system permease protein
MAGILPGISDILIGGALRGGMYVLIALGLSLVWGVMKIPNFAHGEFYLIGAYACYFGIISFHMPATVAVLFAALVGLVMGAIIEKLTFCQLRRRSKGNWVTNTFLVAAGISFIIQNLAQYLFTANFFGVEKLWGGTLQIGDSKISADRLIAFGIAMAALAVFWLFLKKTRTGNAILAVSEHETGAMLMGVSIDRIHTLTFSLSCMLCALAGGALLPFTPAYPTMGMQPLYAAWFVVILVGLGNLESTIVGGFIVGLIEVTSTYYLGAAWQNVASLSVIILILLIKPTGLFGKKVKI